MDLDDGKRFRELDPQNMLGSIDVLPDQLHAAWSLGQSLPLPEMESVRQIVIAGVGGSAIGGDLVVAFAAPQVKIPICVWRDYGLPSYAAGPHTLVLVASHSGNTEETLESFEHALHAEAQVLAITTGGELSRRAQAADIPVWQFEHAGQPRAAIGFSAGLQLAALHRLGFLPDPASEIENAVASMRAQQEELRVEVPVVHNPAKRMAGQLIDRWPVFVGADLLAPVARRWRTQVAELAKAVAQFEVLPEADHNMLAGLVHPYPFFERIMMLFLRSEMNHPRNLLRIDSTRQTFMLEGFGTDIIEARGETRLAQQWTCLHFGDYLAYYLAMAYGIDPTPVQAIETLKDQLKSMG
ncbi:MAG TPA: bifunctional phosphoglucose/phosphomannose isomerase [Anaerolineae bacterium]|nr:bifunctional phosphoglucose/phosphomannose isomerase [Anaerolineae bacterium]